MDKQKALERRNAVKQKIAAKNSEFVTGKKKEVEYDGDVYEVRPLTLKQARKAQEDAAGDPLKYAINVVTTSTYLKGADDAPFFDASDEIFWNNQPAGGLLQSLKKASDELVTEAEQMGKPSAPPPDSSPA